MKRAFLTAFGTPSDVVELHEVADPKPANDEVLVEILAAAINPAELLLIQGLYATRPPLPYPLGVEAVGRVTEIGSKTKGFKEGDTVLCLPTQNWAEKLCFKEMELIKLPDGIDPLQAAQIKVNLATAHCLLEDYVDLQQGDWIIQNAANSSVGHLVVQLAKQRGYKTANLVRREGPEEAISALGGDVVSVEYKDFRKTMEAECDRPIRLALDAVGGKASRRLADCLGDGAKVVNYGALSGKDCRLRAQHTIFHNISLHGFWLSSKLKEMKSDKIFQMYQELAGLVASGDVKFDIEATYALENVEEALDHAMKEGRNGKIIITPVTD